MNKLLRSFLWPISALYCLITAIRNTLYEVGWLRSTRLGVCTIVVGNLKVGGTGKTPFVEYLARYFIDEKKEFCILSRGYGRRSNGFKEANSLSGWEEIGDEPFQYFTKFSSHGVKVFVGENRVAAIKEIMRLFPNTKLIILDDAFQHRALRADRYILLTEYQQPFYLDYVMPMGWLRESRSGASRANAVIVTKSPDQVSAKEREHVRKSLAKYTAPLCPSFFTKTNYLPIISLKSGKELPHIGKVVLVSGIANPSYFLQYCKSRYQVIESIEYPDHHEYTLQDIASIRKQITSLAGEFSVLTTEKDASRLKKFLHDFGEIQIGYLPIQMEFDGEENKAFKQLLDSWLSS